MLTDPRPAGTGALSRRLARAMLRVLRPGGLVAYSFCSRPVRRRDRWRKSLTRAVVHALFAGHFLGQEPTPFHDCATSRHSTFAAGAASVILLGSCRTVTAAGTAGPLRSTQGRR